MDCETRLIITVRVEEIRHICTPTSQSEAKESEGVVDSLN
jgi:hypothetical protein